MFGIQSSTGSRSDYYRFKIIERLLQLTEVIRNGHNILKPFDTNESHSNSPDGKQNKPNNDDGITKRHQQF